MNWKLLAAGLGLTLPMIWVLAKGFGHDPHELPSMLEGRQAPGFTLQTLDGQKTMKLADLQGQRVVLNFWATWCVPCAQEHAGLQEAARLSAGEGVQFLGILYADDPAKATKYLERMGSGYPHLLDPDQKTAMDYGVSGVPETFLLDQQGRILEKYVGPVTANQLLSDLGIRP